MFDPGELDRIFGALAHAGRRRILDLVKAEPGATVGEVAGAFRTSRIAVMRHIGVLEEAGLLVSRREGRCRRLHVNAAPLKLALDRWMSGWSELWARNLAGLKYGLEERREPWRKQGSSPASTSRPRSRPRGARSPRPGRSSGPASTPSS